MNTEDCRITASDPSRIQIADAVHHAPTGEDWLVARVTETHVYPAGWPPCRAEIADCTLLKKASEESRRDMIQRLSRLPASDARRIVGPAVENPFP